MGDMNAKIGCGRREDLVGPFGLGDANDRGDKLFQFCRQNNCAVMNTWFKMPKRRLYTWTAPAENVRNQIDYIMINKRFRNAIKRVTTYPGADVGSDHNPVVGRFALRFQRKKP